MTKAPNLTAADVRAALTAADVRAALRRRYAAPECAVVFEVAQGTGWKANRRLDAVAMELWPSRGLALHGIEVKVSRADFRRELAAPEKAEEIALFCDYFWIAAPKGVVPRDELPSAWGLLEVDAKGGIRAVKQALKTDAEAIDRGFVAALLRAASRPISGGEMDALLAARSSDLEEGFEERVALAAERKAAERSHAARLWTELVEALGRDPDSFYTDRGVIKAVAVVLESNVAHVYKGLRHLERELTGFRDSLATSIEDLNIPADPEPATFAGRQRSRQRRLGI